MPADIKLELPCYKYGQWDISLKKIIRFLLVYQKFDNQSYFNIRRSNF